MRLWNSDSEVNDVLHVVLNIEVCILSVRHANQTSLINRSSRVCESLVLEPNLCRSSVERYPKSTRRRVIDRDSEIYLLKVFLVAHQSLKCLTKYLLLKKGGVTCEKKNINHMIIELDVNYLSLSRCSYDLGLELSCYSIDAIAFSQCGVDSNRWEGEELLC